MTIQKLIYEMTIQNLIDESRSLGNEIDSLTEEKGELKYRISALEYELSHKDDLLNQFVSGLDAPEELFPNGSLVSWTVPAEILRDAQESIKNYEYGDSELSEPMPHLCAFGKRK